MKSKNSRRAFIKNSSLALGALGSISAFSQANTENIPLEISTTENLKLAGYDVNRVKALVHDKVKVEGYSHTFTKGAIGDLNTNMFNGPQDFDISEVGLHPFMLAYANDQFRDYSLIPIFPLRLFRHKSIFIRNDGKIKTPQDLKGKSIGTTGYSSTSLTWLRGIFEDEYGVSPKDVTWVISNKDSSTEASGNISKQEQILPDGVKIIKGTKGLDESDLLLSGEVDALFHAAEPKAFVERNPMVTRLFSDSKTTEQDYYKKTGVFPIMHTIAIRNSLANQHPELISKVFKAYSKAKAMDFAFMQKLGWAYDSLPWYAQEFEATKSVMGADYWPYGIEKNKKALETLFRYSYEQGLSVKKLKIEDLFHPSSLHLEE